MSKLRNPKEPLLEGQSFQESQIMKGIGKNQTCLIIHFYQMIKALFYRLNNMKSHFVLPTLVNSCGSSAKLSTTTSHSQRSVITAKFKPGYSSPKKAQRGRKLKDVKAEVSESKKQIEINGDKESKTPTLKLSKHDILVKDQEKSLQTQLK